MKRFSILELYDSNIIKLVFLQLLVWGFLVTFGNFDVAPWHILCDSEMFVKYNIA